MIQTKKLTDATLKRIVKSDNTYEDVHITDVPSNVIEEGTLITDTVLNSINYKNDKKVEFGISDVDQEPNNGNAILYAKNGKIYVKISGYQAIEVNSFSPTNYIPKTGIIYASNQALEYFNINSNLRLFSKETKIGAIPERVNQTNGILDATYINFVNGEIAFKVYDEEKIKINNNLLFKNNNAKIEIENDNINISNSIFDIEITNLDIKVKKSNNVLFEISNEGNVLIKNKPIIEALDLASYFKDKLMEYTSKELLTNTISQRLYYTLDNSNYEYTIFFSDTATSDNIMSYTFDGEDIENLTIFYKGKTQSYYSLFNYYASDESEDDFIEIRKVTSSGEFISCSYFRGIYYKIK